ncbi:MAG: sulfatase-like hydrolase/transferase [Kiritimatiellaeota bacterium]|nr:sulfatase-like hydrolase/transferase [Kiritimatiellota bacterium]
MPKPNVVFVIADQHRWDFMGYEDSGRTPTPNLDRLSVRGARFRRAFCTAPLCSPSREALAAGRYGVNTGCFTNLHELPWHTPTFVSRFRENGYHTCAIGKTHMEIHAYDSDLCCERHRAFMDSLGWDTVHEISGNGMLRTGIRCAYSRYLEDRGKLRDVVQFYENWHYFMEKDRGGAPNFKPHCWPFAEELHETAFVGKTAVEWLEQHGRERPFFLHVGFAAPHSPIEPLPRYATLLETVPEPPPLRGGAENTPDWLPDGRRGYRAMIAEVDAWVGRLVTTIDKLGLADSTVFVYTADHGEMAGDRGRTGKTCFYDPAVRVPLILAGPNIRPGIDSEALIELIDLGKTLCELRVRQPFFGSGP